MVKLSSDPNIRCPSTIGLTSPVVKTTSNAAAPRHIISTAIVAILFLVSCNCLMQYMDSGKLTTATHIPTAVVYLVIPISMALAIVHTIVDIKEDFAPAKTETAESEGAEL